jgi:hypothetical protein
MGNIHGKMFAIRFVNHSMQKSQGIHGKIILTSNTSRDNCTNLFSGVQTS